MFVNINMEFNKQQKKVIQRYYKRWFLGKKPFHSPPPIKDIEYAHFMYNLETTLEVYDCHNDISKYEKEVLLKLLEDSKNQIEIGNKDNFSYSDELINSFKNTINEYVSV